MHAWCAIRVSSSLFSAATLAVELLLLPCPSPQVEGRFVPQLQAAAHHDDAAAAATAGRQRCGRGQCGPGSCLLGHLGDVKAPRQAPGEVRAYGSGVPAVGV